MVFQNTRLTMKSTLRWLKLRSGIVFILPIWRNRPTRSNEQCEKVSFPKICQQHSIAEKHWSVEYLQNGRKVTRESHVLQCYSARIQVENELLQKHVLCCSHDRLALNCLDDSAYLLNYYHAHVVVSRTVCFPPCSDVFQEGNCFSNKAKSLCFCLGMRLSAFLYFTKRSS